MRPANVEMLCVAVLCIVAGLLMRPVSMTVSNPPDSSVKAQWFSVFSININRN